MTLFAHRFLTPPESAHTPPGRYDESRAVRVDEAGRPVVSADATTTRAEIDRPHVATFGIVTKAEIDRPHVASLGVATKADIDRDPCRSNGASSAGTGGSPVMLLTKTAGGIDEDEDREPSWQRAARRVSQATP